MKNDSRAAIIKVINNESIITLLFSQLFNNYIYFKMLKEWLI